MNYKINQQKGFTLVELIIVVLLIAALSGIALVNYSYISQSAYDATAESDYREIKNGIKAIIADPNSPSSFIFRQRSGPSVFPAPLNMVALSKDVLASVIYQYERRSNLASLVRISIDVRHKNGSKRFRYFNSNGNESEQVQ